MKTKILLSSVFILLLTSCSSVAYFDTFLSEKSGPDFAVVSAKSVCGYSGVDHYEVTIENNLNSAVFVNWKSSYLLFGDESIDAVPELGENSAIDIRRLKSTCIPANKTIVMNIFGNNRTEYDFGDGMDSSLVLCLEANGEKSFYTFETWV